MNTDFDRIEIKPGGWKDAIAAIGRSSNDMFLYSGDVADPEAAARALQRIALANGTLGLLAAATVKPFEAFGGPSQRIFSCGRKILTPLGLTAERANLHWGDAVPVRPANAGPHFSEAESIWGSAVYVKRCLLNATPGFDPAYDTAEAPNLIWDDFCLQARQLGYGVACTMDVTASITEASAIYPTRWHSAFERWKTKWGWDPCVPNIYHLRERWQGTSIGRPMIEDLVDTWSRPEPMVDVIMLTGNSLGKLKATLDSLAKTTYPRLTLHLLTNGSSATVRRYLEDLARPGNYTFGIDLLQSPVNVGVPAGLNWLLTRCSAPVIARLDDDLELPPEWLTELVGTLRQFPLAGAAIPAMTIPGTDGVQYLVAPMRLHPEMCSDQPTDKMPAPPYRSIYQTNFLTGAVVVARRKAMLKAGPFDLRFSPTQNEDIDHGLAMRAAGYDLIVNGRLLVVHHTDGIWGGSYEHFEACRAGRQFFIQKWGRAQAVLETALDRDGRVIEP